MIWESTTCWHGKVPSEPCPDCEKEAENSLWHQYAAAAITGEIVSAEATTAPVRIASWAADTADAMIVEAKKRGRL